LHNMRNAYWTLLLLLVIGMGAALYLVQEKKAKSAQQEIDETFAIELGRVSGALGADLSQDGILLTANRIFA